MDDYVLIVAPAGDEHALTVAAHIEQLGVEALVWDSARLPATDRLSQYVSSTGPSRPILETESMGAIDLSKARSVWWRRPAPPAIPISTDDELVKSYCRYETTQLLRGALSSLGPVIHNDPDAEEKALRKAYHLTVAADVGLSVPLTIMTSSPERVRIFQGAVPHATVVFKPFQAPSGSGCTTQELTNQHVDKLDLLANAPVIFQEMVPPGQDVRVAVIGEEIYAGISENDNLDWRVDPDLTWRAHDLPVEMKHRIHMLMSQLSLTMGHLDFRIAPDGTYCFFEVNPSGQYLFLEVHDRELAITSAIALLLTRKSPGS